MYPDHATALEKAGLAPEHFPMLNKLWEKEESLANADEEKSKNKKEKFG